LQVDPHSAFSIVVVGTSKQWRSLCEVSFKLWRQKVCCHFSTPHRYQM